jgi:ubiquinone/menaquinone biosynthesis C-methylase UbiE
MAEGGMRATWDAAAASADIDRYVGDPATARAELDGFFSRLGDDPRGGTCVEVGCGPGRMTSLLAGRFDRVVAVDVSPAMLERARASVGAASVEFRLVAGDRLDSLEDAAADVLVCYLVLQHLPERRVVLAYLQEFARVLAPGGRAFVQLPVLDDGLRSGAWRVVRGALVPLASRLGRGVEHGAAYRGTRLTERELQEALAAAGLRVAVRDESSTSPYRYAHEVFLRLERAA